MNCEQARESCVLFAIPTPLDAHDSKCKGEVVLAWSHHYHHRLSKLQAIHENPSPSPSPNFPNHHGPHNTLTTSFFDHWCFQLQYFVFGWKHIMGGGEKIVIALYCFSKVHVWTLTMSILWKIFTMFLHLCRQNPKKWNATKVAFFLCLTHLKDNFVL